MQRFLVAALAAAAVFAAPAAAAGDLLGEVNAYRSAPLVRDAALESSAADCVAQMVAADTVERCADAVGAAPDPRTLAGGWYDSQAQTRTEALFAVTSNRGGCAFDGQYGACDVAYVAPPKPTPKPSPKPAARRPVRRSRPQAVASGGTTTEKEHPPPAIPTPSPVPTPSFTPSYAAAAPRIPAQDPAARLPVAAVAVGIVGAAAFAVGVVRGRRRRIVDLETRLNGPR